MSCALDEIDSSGPADTIFRPFYSIPGYSSSSRRWVEEYPVSSRNPRKVVINVGDMQTISWSDLGFSNFLNPELPAEATKWLKKVTITLSCTSISSFDVNRGLWYVIIYESGF